MDYKYVYVLFHVMINGDTETDFQNILLFWI